MESQNQQANHQEEDCELETSRASLEGDTEASRAGLEKESRSKRFVQQHDGFNEQVRPNKRSRLEPDQERADQGCSWTANVFNRALHIPTASLGMFGQEHSTTTAVEGPAALLGSQNDNEDASLHDPGAAGGGVRVENRNQETEAGELAESQNRRGDHQEGVSEPETSGAVLEGGSGSKRSAHNDAGVNEDDQLEVPTDNEYSSIEDLQDQDTNSVDWLELPTAALAVAFEWLSFVEGRHFFSCNKALWMQKRIEYESQFIHELVLPGTPPCSFLDNLQNVERLDLGPYCTDEILRYMHSKGVHDDKGPLPKLNHLGMARSLQVTDEGLRHLVKDPELRKALETLDIAFCRRVSYELTLIIRKLLVALKFIRRQPPWMDGKTIYEDGGCLKQWPDGSYVEYEADGTMSRLGFYCDLYEPEGRVDNREHRVICKTKDVHRHGPEGDYFRNSPNWMRFANQEAESFLRVPDEGTVLLARPLHGIYPISGTPHVQHAISVPVGKHVNDDTHRDRSKHFCVDHCRLGPLGERMPSQDLVEKLHAHLEHAKNVLAGEDPKEVERDAHVHAGGRKSKTPPSQWSRYYS